MRDFDAEASAVDPEAPVDPDRQFTLGGRTWTCRVKDDVPWNLVHTVFSVNDDGEVLIQVEPFFRGVLIPADVDAFLEMVNAPDSALTEGNAPKVMEYVAEKVLGRPTEPSANSSAGPKPRGRSSKAGSSSPDTPRIASVG